MIAVDSNILVHAHRRDSSWHAPAKQRLGALAMGSAAWAIPWPDRDFSRFPSLRTNNPLVSAER
jgi:predicted nucleic acid-binding protein